MVDDLAAELQVVPDRLGYAYGSTYAAALGRPIPRVFWPTKPESADAGVMHVLWPELWRDRVGFRSPSSVSRTGTSASAGCSWSRSSLASPAERHINGSVERRETRSSSLFTRLAGRSSSCTCAAGSASTTTAT